MADYEVKITSEPKLFEFNIKELFRYRDLIRFQVKKNFSLIYKQTILGPLWLILNPLISSIIYTFIFGRVVGVSTDGIPPFIFYLTSTALWNLFTNTFSGTSSTFLVNSGIFGKVYFPRMTIPISQSISSILKFAIQFLMLLVFYVIYAFKGFQIHLSWYLIFVPVLILQASVLGMAIGIIVSSLTVKYRDLSILSGFIIQLWMYATPVLYPVNYLNGFIYHVIRINPMTAVIVNFRYCMLGSGSFMVVSWLGSILITIILLLLGVALFNRTEKNFIDVI